MFFLKNLSGLFIFVSGQLRVLQYQGQLVFREAPFYEIFEAGDSGYGFKKYTYIYHIYNYHDIVLII